MTLTTRPLTPTTSMSGGSCIVSGLQKRFTDSTRIEKQSAIKKTAFTNAPNTSARAHPNVFLDHRFGDIRTDMYAMTSATTSDNM